jgi:hypothetical protein
MPLVPLAIRQGLLAILLVRGAVVGPHFRLQCLSQHPAPLRSSLEFTIVATIKSNIYVCRPFRVSYRGYDNPSDTVLDVS